MERQTCRPVFTAGCAGHVEELELATAQRIPREQPIERRGGLYPLVWLGIGWIVVWAILWLGIRIVAVAVHLLLVTETGFIAWGLWTRRESGP